MKDTTMTNHYKKPGGKKVKVVTGRVIVDPLQEILRLQRRQNGLRNEADKLQENIDCLRYGVRAHQNRKPFSDDLQNERITTGRKVGTHGE